MGRERKGKGKIWEGEVRGWQREEMLEKWIAREGCGRMEECRTESERKGET